jgi:serine/threonine protein kinase
MRSPSPRSSFKDKRVHRGTLSLPGAKKPSVVAVLQVNSSKVGAEVGVLMKMSQDQPRLVQFFGQCIDGANTLLVMELAPMGSLSQALESIESNMTREHRVAILQQVCSAMETLAANKLIHRDLALRNVLLFSYDPTDVSKTSVKVSDCGLAVSACPCTRRLALDARTCMISRTSCNLNGTRFASTHLALRRYAPTTSCHARHHPAGIVVQV